MMNIIIPLMNHFLFHHFENNKEINCLAYKINESGRGKKNLLNNFHNIFLHLL